MAAPEPTVPAGTPVTKPKAAGKSALGFTAHPLLARLHGVDLCAVPGINVLTAQTLWSELGADLSAFPTAKHFASWLGVCPDKRVSDSKILSARTKPTTNRLACALRVAVQALHHAENEFGEHYRRMAAKLGGAVAVTALANKLARILYVLITTRLSANLTPRPPGCHRRTPLHPRPPHHHGETHQKAPYSPASLNMTPCDFGFFQI